ELGEVADGQAEARDVSRERRTLQDQRAAVDAELRQARLAVVEGSQLLERIAAMRQQRFFGLLSERTTPPWRPAFWRQLAASAPRDSSRLERLWQQTRDASLSHWKEAGIQPLVSLVVAGLVLAGSWLLRLRLTGMAATRVPAGRLRRSAPAMLRVVLALVASLCVMQLLRGALLPDNPPAAVAAIASRVVALGVFVAVATSLGRALLSVSRPSWRLPAISDAGARALRIFPLPAARGAAGPAGRPGPGDRDPGAHQPGPGGRLHRPLGGAVHGAGAGGAGADPAPAAAGAGRRHAARPLPPMDERGGEPGLGRQRHRPARPAHRLRGAVGLRRHADDLGGDGRRRGMAGDALHRRPGVRGAHLAWCGRQAHEHPLRHRPAPGRPGCRAAVGGVARGGGAVRADRAGDA